MAYEEITRAVIKAGAFLTTTLGLRVRNNFEDHEDRIGDLEAIGLAIPPGIVIKRALSTVPTGYLACDGSAVSRTTYASLFAVIGTTFGVGDGSATFNVPDMRGRIPIGAGTGSGLTARTLGQSIGEETHQLTISELPSHSHTTQEPNGGSGHRHTHGSANSNTPSGSSNFINSLMLAVITAGSVADTVSTTPTINHSTTGSNTAHANMMPCLPAAFMIKT